MRRSDLAMIGGWLLVIGGLLWGYAGLTGVSLQYSLFGSGLANLLNIVIGAVALYVAYEMLTTKRSKKK